MKYISKIKQTIEHAWYVANPLERAIIIFGCIVIVLCIITLIVLPIVRG